MAGASGKSNLASRWWVRLLETLVVLLVLAWVVRILWLQLRDVDPHTLRFQALPIALSLAGGCLANFIFGLLVVLVDFKALGHPVSWSAGVALSNLPRLGKYVPGKVHAVLGLVWLAHRMERVPVQVSSSLALLLAVQGVAISLLSGSLLLPWIPLSLYWQVCLAGSGCLALIMLHPILCLGPVNWLLLKLNLPPIEKSPSYLRALALGAAAAALNLGKVFLFVVLAESILDLPAGVEAHLALAYILAALGGFVAFFAPAGLGVQEGAMLLLLAPAVSPDQAAILTVAARVWSTALDLILGIVGGVVLACAPGRFPGPLPPARVNPPL